MTNLRSAIFSVAGAMAVIVAFATTHPAPVLGDDPAPAPSIPAQECGGDQSGDSGMRGALVNIAGANSAKLWTRDTLAIFPQKDPGGLSYMAALQTITSNPLAPVPAGGDGGNMQASAMQTASAQMNLTQSLHFASIHLTGEYTGQFRCIGLAPGVYYIVGSFYRNTGNDELRNQFSNAGIPIPAQSSPLVFQPTYFYRRLVSVTYYEDSDSTYAIVPEGGKSCTHGGPASPLPPASFTCWEYMGVHPTGFRKPW